MIDWRDYDAPLLSPILQAALDSFVTGGFHGTSIRQLAGAAGLSVPGLYHHFASKHAILAEIDRLAMEDLWQRSVAALADGGQEPTARFDRLIECLLLFHAHQSDLAFIAFSEIRALKDQHRDAHIAARDRQQKLLDDVVEECVADGSFTTGSRGTPRVRSRRSARASRSGTGPAVSLILLAWPNATARSARTPPAFR